MSTDKNQRQEESPDSDFTKQWPMELSDYLKFDDDHQWIEDDNPHDQSFVSEHVTRQFYDQAINNEVGDIGGGSSSHFEGSSSRGGHEEKKEAKERFAFKTKSEIEILHDGYKWKKYGKKMVKNSPNPRNYYRCSVDGCSVKKRVERDRDDPRYVITTYEGVHTHPSAS